LPQLAYECKALNIATTNASYILVYISFFWNTNKAVCNRLVDWKKAVELLA